MRLGQNFLADPNLLDSIVRDSGVGPDDVVLEVGVGEGVLTRRLAEVVSHVKVIEIDSGLEPFVRDLEETENVDLIWADAVKFDFSTLDPQPTAMVANLPYAVATPVILETLFALPGISSWTVMVQKEIADRLRTGPGSKIYGAPSVLLQAAAEVKLVRKVSRKMFRPQPRVDSAIISIKRTGPAPSAEFRRLVRAAFSHRRKAMPRSVDMAIPGSLQTVKAGLEGLDIDAGIRAEALTAAQFEALSAMIELPPEPH